MLTPYTSCPRYVQEEIRIYSFAKLTCAGSAILRELGYEGPDAQTDMITSYECLFRRTNSLGTTHTLDIHWKINNAQLFARTFTFDELLAEAIEIPSFAGCARGLGYTHALLLACMHRYAHAHAPFYVDGNRYMRAITSDGCTIFICCV